jgi:hypothetical protein
MASNKSQSNNPLEQFPKLPNEAGVRVTTAMALLDCSESTIWRLARAGKLKACKVSENVTVFNVGSLRAVLNGGC